MSAEQTVNFTVRKMERCVCASFVYGEDSFNSPYFTVYFIVNNSGIIAVYDKSTPSGTATAGGGEVYLDQLKSAGMELKKGQDKYEVLAYIYDELGRIGEKLQKEGRPLLDSDISKLLTKLGSRFKA
ncbi:hypothetical protein [Effusibacillus pohliae]|uniref:hypothetical protein n=1 Tax=Effusibacillus pohliae TaxID=232270 RepID=UPI00036C49DE|nr:hypothetical protein [Effusibacillus pohliae]